MSTAELLTRRQRASRRDRAGASVHPRETGRDPLAADYERGPFVDLVVPDFPAGLLALLERRTGQRVPPEVLAEYERIRAYTGYPGPTVGPREASHAALVDPLARRAAAPPVTPPPPARSVLATPARRTTLEGAEAPDPEDLGD